MNRFVLRGLLAWAACAAATVTVIGQQDLPRFSAAVELTSLDVSVFDDKGHPIEHLKPEDFVVKIDGDIRPVVSAQWIQLQTPERAAATVVPEGYSSNESTTGGRLILIVVDQPNIRFGGTMAIRKSVDAFIDRLEPSDRAAVVGIGAGSPSTPFTADRDRLKRAVEQMTGQYQTPAVMLHNIGVAEALNIVRGATGTLGDVVNRECQDSVGRMLTDTDLDACMFEIEHEAQDIARTGAADGRDTMTALRGLLTALRQVDAPKTLLLVSEGFLVDDAQQDVIALGTLAAAARTSIYAIKLDDQLFALAASESRVPVSRMDDRVARSEGLELLAGASRGSLFTVVGTGAGVFERIQAELSGYYLLGVESGPADRDGKAHPIHVEVGRKGVTVRTRRALIASAPIPAPRNPREAVMSALSTPLPASALPIRVATYSLQGPEDQKIQLLIHADIGTDYSSSRVVSLGYVINDRDGRIVDSQASTARLLPVMNGVPSSLQFSGGASVPPGEYVLKLAIAEGDRVGTVEHAFTAGTAPAGQVRVSDLMVGGPVFTQEVLLQPTVGYSVVFGTLHGYIEAYGDGLSQLKARYEVVSDAAGAALLSVDVSPRLAGSARAIFSQTMPVRQLPPGPYLLRVTLTAGTEGVRTLTRPFEIATPAVLMTSASAPSVTTVSDVYLPVTETLLSREFDAAEAERPATVKAFRDRVADKARPAFDQGVRALSAGAYEEAETSFKSAISVDDDSTAVLAYMAATYAASGHDTEAAGAWQTALIDGSDLPEIYDWLAGALLRSHDLAMARSVLEEAIGKWPSDPRFARPMALVYATFGSGAEAVRSLERHIAAHPDDVDSLVLGVEWIYQLHSAGAVAHTPADDVKLARTYGDAYLKTKGPQAALVRQWLDFLERK